MMTPKQQAFSEHYLRTGDLQTSAQEAGISYDYAKDLRCGKKSPSVKLYINEALSELADAGRADALAEREERVRAFERLSAKAEAERNWPAAIKALREACLLQGYYTHKVETNGKMSVVDLIASLDPSEFDE